VTSRQGCGGIVGKSFGIISEARHRSRRTPNYSTSQSTASTVALKRIHPELNVIPSASRPPAMLVASEAIELMGAIRLTFPRGIPKFHQDLTENAKTVNVPRPKARQLSLSITPVIAALPAQRLAPLLSVTGTSRERIAGTPYGALYEWPSIHPGTVRTTWNALGCASACQASARFLYDPDDPPGSVPHPDIVNNCPYLKRPLRPTGICTQV
jgi:hypothetical protein